MGERPPRPDRKGVWQRARTIWDNTQFRNLNEPPLMANAALQPELAGSPPAPPVTFPDSPYRLHQTFEPAGDQPEAIAKLT